MSTPTLQQFITEHECQLEQIFIIISELNEKLTFEDFCNFAYQHSY